MALNGWFRRLGADPDSPVETLDATGRSVGAVADAVAEWISTSLDGPGAE